MRSPSPRMSLRVKRRRTRSARVGSDSPSPIPCCPKETSRVTARWFRRKLCGSAKSAIVRSGRLALVPSSRFGNERSDCVSGDRHGDRLGLGLQGSSPAAPHLRARNGLSRRCGSDPSTDVPALPVSRSVNGSNPSAVVHNHACGDPVGACARRGDGGRPLGDPSARGSPYIDG